MKSIFTSAILLSIFFIFSGCATTQPSEATSSVLDDMQAHLNEILTQLDETENSLNDITNADESTLEDAYDSYTDDVSRSEDLKDDFEDLVVKMRSNSSEYLSAWEDETENYENKELRRGSESRLEEVRRAINNVRNNSSNVNKTFENYLSDIEEIESYLANDLTMSGVEAVYSISQDMEDSGDELRQEINTLQRSISDTKSEMGQKSPANTQ